MTGSRRLSQAISAGDGISVIAVVGDAAARAAEEQGAEALAVTGAVAGLRDATSLPILWLGATAAENADACLLRVGEADSEFEAPYDAIVGGGYECVVDVSNEEELRLVLEWIDPEIFLLSPREAGEGVEALERVLDLLPDVPAGKLAIAELPLTTREDVVALERAGVDAVLVASGDVDELVGAAPPEV